MKTYHKSLILALAFLSSYTGLSLFFLKSAVSQAAAADGKQASYLSLFQEETLTVTQEQDGLMEGNLRTVLTQANGIRAQSPYTVVKIGFSPQVRHVRITKGPLPSLEGSLTTLECFNGKEKVLIEYIPEENSLADNNSSEAYHEESEEDLGEEANALTVRSHSNTVRGCHFTGASQAGLAIYGNHNIIEHNALGYLPELSGESSNGAPLVAGPLKGNQGPGLKLGKDANENFIQYNDLIGNNGAGILLDKGVGTGNQLAYNYFVKNQGAPIQASPNPWQSKAPSLETIEDLGESWELVGTSTPRSKIQIYAIDPEAGDIRDLVAEIQTFERSQGEAQFRIEIPKNRVTSPALIALAQSEEYNTSEFSAPYLMPGASLTTEVKPSVPNPSAPIVNPSSTSTPNPQNPSQETVIDLFKGKGP